MAEAVGVSPSSSGPVLMDVSALLEVCRASRLCSAATHRRCQALQSSRALDRAVRSASCAWASASEKGAFAGEAWVACVGRCCSAFLASFSSCAAASSLAAIRCAAVLTASSFRCSSLRRACT